MMLWYIFCDTVLLFLFRSISVPFPWLHILSHHSLWILKFTWVFIFSSVPKDTTLSWNFSYTYGNGDCILYKKEWRRKQSCLVIINVSPAQKSSWPDTLLFWRKNNKQSVWVKVRVNIYVRETSFYMNTDHYSRGLNLCDEFLFKIIIIVTVMLWANMHVLQVNTENNKKSKGKETKQNRLDIKLSKVIQNQRNFFLLHYKWDYNLKQNKWETETRLALVMNDKFLETNENKRRLLGHVNKH